MADLDSLIVDLESTIEQKARREGDRVPRITIGCGRDKGVFGDNMTTAALSNNLNELDILLQDLSEDLSAARYSGHVDRTESISESTRVYSSQTNGYVDQYDGVVVPPKPPERTKSRSSVGKYTNNVNNGVNGDDMMNKEKYVEETQTTVTRTEESRTIHTENGGNLESKWEYMGFGIWENKDPDDSTPPQTVRYHSDQQSTVRNSTQVDSTSASSATAELDELMTSLNNFKMGDRNVDEPVISGPPTLDDMLGNLQEDMNKQGIKTTQKGVCGACSKPIVGQVITALGHTWHPEHFTCSHCNQELGTRNFFERDGKPFCEQDYHHLFSPRCGYCQGPILDKCISALDKTWHPEHFICADCGKQFGDDGFHEKDDAAYCKDCYFEQFAPKCGGCTNAITENYISSLNTQVYILRNQMYFYS
jgi:paxillin